MIVPTFSRRPMVAHTWVAIATMLTGLIGFGVWVHHMFATGLPQLTLIFFSAASMMVVIPSGLQVFAWCATLITGRPLLRTPLLYVLGFVVVFVIGGLTGVMFAAIPFDQQITDSYFVVAHFHYVLFGGAVFPMFAGFHYWYPKVTGRLYSEPVAQVAFWLFFVGFNLTFFPMHVAGLLGMPRRVYTYPHGLSWDPYNLASTIGAFLLAGAILLVFGNFAWSRFAGRPAGPDPWLAPSLEWATSSPPPEYSFARIPAVRGQDPNCDEPRGQLVLDEGHETPGTTVLDADFDEVLEMPGETPWPLVLALCVSGTFVFLLTSRYVVAAIFVGLAGLAIAGWNLKE
jgi:heme/copper-type cytochrome/quinol oxidase subunit 1